MKPGSDEVLKQLNRLVNDRNLSIAARNRVRDGVLCIKTMQLKLDDFLNEEAEFESVDSA